MDEPFAWLTIAVAAVVTYMWRALGVALAGRVAPDSKVLEWVTCVAYALLAGLVARMILVPVGPLAEVALWMRLTAVAACVACYLAAGRRLLPGVLAGAATLAGLVTVFGL